MPPFRPLLSALPLLALAGLLSGCETPASGGEAPAPAASATPANAGPLAIAAVQGSGPRSPYEGQTVTVEGVVVGNFATGLGGVFLQSETEDGDPATAEGLFLRRTPDSEPRLRTGDRVRATGTVVEDGRGDTPLTTLVDAEVTVLAAQVPLPEPLVLAGPPAEAALWERLEGRRLRIAVPLTVTGNDGLARYGELAVSFGERLFQPTELAPPGPQADAVAADNARRLLLLDDNRSGEYPKSLWFLPGPWDDDAPLRAGSTLPGAEGVLDQRHGRYRLQLTEKLAIASQAPRPPAPTVPGDLRLASLNLLNLFNGDGRGGGFPTERGAASTAEYRRQQAKLVAVVQSLQPDIAALMEVENDGDEADSALAQFVAALNAAGPARDWRAVTGAESGTDSIRVALIYRERRVRPVGLPATLAEGPFLDRSRVPLAQAFRVGRGPAFVVVANHFKSKGSCDGASPGDNDAGDHQGCWNATRLDSARRLHDWLASDPTGEGSERMVLLGDFNAYRHEDPIRLLVERGWQDALAKAERPWSYVWNGQAGRLDHALLSAGLAGRLRGAAEWHNNADESERFAFDRDDDQDPWRASDHDPLLVGLDLAR